MRPIGQYVETQNQLKVRDAPQKKQNEEKQKVEKKITPEVQEVLDKGNEFLGKDTQRAMKPYQEWRSLRKISRMELIMQKIFRPGKGASGDHSGPEQADGLLSAYDCEAFGCLRGHGQPA